MRTAEGTAIVAFQWECSFRNQVTAGQRSSLEACFLTEDVCNPCNEVVCKAFTCRHIPSLHERCPVELDTHHVVDAPGDFSQSVGRNGIQCMEQLLTHAEAVFLQTGDECHHRSRSFAFHVDVLTVDVEEHCSVAQSYICQSLVVHNVLNLKGNWLTIGCRFS